MERDPNMPGILFHALNRAHRNAVEAELTAAGLEGLRSPLLLMLLQSRNKDGEITAQRDLADAMHVSPAAIAMSLRTLERMGYVEKRSDARDQRRKRVTVTAQGAAAVDKCWQVLSSVNVRMMEGFTTAERDQLNGYHRRMLQNLYSGAGDPLENPFERMGCQCSKH